MVRLRSPQVPCPYGTGGREERVGRTGVCTGKSALRLCSGQACATCKLRRAGGGSKRGARSGWRPNGRYMGGGGGQRGGRGHRKGTRYCAPTRKKKSRAFP